MNKTRPLPWKAGLLVLALFAIVGIGLWQWIRSNEEISEVVVTGFMNLFGLLTTPFILETSLALLGLVAVMTYNQWRISKEGDGWVYLAEVEGEVSEEDRKGRLSGVVVGHPSDLESEEAAMIATVEGFLELGLAKEAIHELEQGGGPVTSASRLLGIRSRLMLGQRAEAVALWEQWCAAEKGQSHELATRQQLESLFNGLGGGDPADQRLAAQWQGDLNRASTPD